MRGAKRRFLDWLARRFQQWADGLITRTMCRPPDFVIGGRGTPYALRWYLLGGEWKYVDGKERLVSRRIFGCRPYLHCFLRSDDNRALHDHPARSVSLALRGEGVEHTIAAGGVHYRRRIGVGKVRFRSATFAHRIEIAPGADLWTLFIFFRDAREWGFHCPNGWVHWREFTADDDRGAVGRGCGEDSPRRPRHHVTVPAPLQKESGHVH